MTDSCDLSQEPLTPKQNPDFHEIAAILRDCKRIAVVGLSDKPARASHGVGLYMREQGYTIHAVHPNITEWEGQDVYRSLGEINEPIDMVDIFLATDKINGIVDEIIAVKPKVAWMQLGLVNEGAAARLRHAGIVVV